MIEGNDKVQDPTPKPIDISKDESAPRPDLNWIPYRNEFIDDYKAMINSYLELSSSPRIWACKIVPAYRDIWDIKDSIIYGGHSMKSP